MPARAAAAAAHRPIGALVATLLLLATGCAGVPRPELQAYSDAFARAQEGGIAVYRAMIPALQQESGATVTAASYPASLGPERYDRTDCPAEFAAYQALLVRCAAMGAVRGFGETMLALEQGASLPAVQGRLVTFKESVGLLGLLVPAVGQALAPVAPLVPVLEQVVAQLVNLRDRAALKAELDRAAPLIEQILAALAEDVPKIYDVQRAYFEVLLRETEGRVNLAVRDALRAAALQGPPADPAAIAARRRADERFERIFSAPEPSPGDRRLRDLGEPGGAPFALDHAAVVEASLDATEREVAAFRGHVAGWQRFREALVAYDDMLAAVRLAFTRLTTASADPFAAGGGTAQVLESAYAIRTQVAEIRRLLEARP